MELKLIHIDRMSTSGAYKLLLEYGEQQIQGIALIYEGAIESINYDQVLDSILHKNVGCAKNLSSAIFEAHKNIAIELPLTIGNF
jgi:hypothetical protein